MASFFTLPELRAELHSLGHDDVPDHVIVSFLTQLRITVPSCFGVSDRSPFESNEQNEARKNHNFEQDTLRRRDSAVADARLQDSWRKCEKMEVQLKATNKYDRNGRFYESFLDLDDDRFYSQPETVSRPDTPPRHKAPVFIPSDSEACKENSSVASFSSASVRGDAQHSYRQALQPCENMVAEEITGTRKASQFLYPGDLLAQLKERQRPFSCPAREQNNSDAAQVTARSQSAGDPQNGCPIHSSIDIPGRCSSVPKQSQAMESIELKLRPLNVGVTSHREVVGGSRYTDTELPADGRPSSRGSIRSSCAACTIFSSRQTPRQQPAGTSTPVSSMKLGDSDSSTASSPLASTEAENTQRTKASSAATISPTCSEGSGNGSHATSLKKPVLRRGKIDRVARFAEMQKLWSKDHFLKVTNGKRKKQSFHRMFAEIHASNEKEYAASRARSVVAGSTDEELPPFVFSN